MLSKSLLVALAGLTSLTFADDEQALLTPQRFSGALLNKDVAFLLPGTGSPLVAFGAVSASCDIGEKGCDGKCIPTTGSCCGIGTGGYCELGKYCVTGGCCPIGKTCSGSASGCSAGKVSCNGYCIPSGTVCCSDGGYCNAGETCTANGYCSKGGGGGGGSGTCDVGKERCGTGCMPTGQTCCTTYYCDSDQTCAGDKKCRNPGSGGGGGGGGGCASGQTSCGTGCMPTGNVCCESYYCLTGQTCVGDKKCRNPSGGGGGGGGGGSGGGCAAGQTACGTGCMPTGNVCCSTYYCLTGQTCYGDNKCRNPGTGGGGGGGGGGGSGDSSTALLPTSIVAEDTPTFTFNNFPTSTDPVREDVPTTTSSSTSSSARFSSIAPGPSTTVAVAGTGAARGGIQVDGVVLVAGLLAAAPLVI
ncbi:uncharacterized protein CTRU02_204709 [Colletotrichum truncatum]|uniref:Uncharacterized protein n=1 Tax=Colletotrichum truncatum TaxID=5467 RepID=A0ACC3ZCV7_COLTU|nr:uncharacterized protein CTRU02_02942 [Colletotrichum truncatum]KAF6797899.1 hypothetical protein CTRU02_02942 [Colletotrichum truncatum]